MLKILRPLFFFIFSLSFRLTLHGKKVVQSKGAQLVIANHQSSLDAFFLWIILGNSWKFVIHKSSGNPPFFLCFLEKCGLALVIDPSSPNSVRAILHELSDGGRLIIFPEGGVSFTGRLRRFQPGTGFIVSQNRAPTTLCYIHGSNRSQAAKHSGWKRLFPRISVHFSEFSDMPARGAKDHEIDPVGSALRRAMLELELFVTQTHEAQTIPEAIAASAVMLKNHIVIEDLDPKSARVRSYTYRQIFLIASLFANKLRLLLPSNSSHVGVLLPNLSVVVFAILAIWKRSLTPTLLNYSSGVSTMVACCRLAGLKHVVTSRGFLEKINIDPQPFIDAGVSLIYAEDIAKSINIVAKLSMLIRSHLPGFFNEKSSLAASSPAFILFTSGSEATPKGVVLSHSNILANVRQLIITADLTDADRLFTALPVFHSFGLTVGLMMPLVAGQYVFLYPSPLHFKFIPTVVYDRRCTVLTATNTFLKGWAQYAHPYDFHTVRRVFAGGEKIEATTSHIWAERFGARVLEGYGATECSPVVSMNSAVSSVLGSVGQLLPGIKVKQEPVEGISQGGRLYVKGPNVMLGYLEAGGEKIIPCGEYYDTGDIVRFDEQGYMFIIGRVKRFAKIAGEMVSLEAVEKTLSAFVQTLDATYEVAVVSIYRSNGGEHLVSVTNCKQLNHEMSARALREGGLPPLACPKENQVWQEIPRLGNGKTDYQEILRRVSATKEQSN